MVTKGSTATVVRGVKVPRGTTGVVIWTGETKYGWRVGIKDAAGTVHFTAMGNVEPAGAPAPPTGFSPAVAGAVAATAAMAAPDALAALTARVAALEALLGLTAGAPLPLPQALPLAA